MVKQIVLNKIDCEHLIGTFLDERHYDTLLDEDCDVYYKTELGLDDRGNGEHNVVLKFRKNWFTKEQQIGAYDGLMEAAKPTQNRALAAGPLAGETIMGRYWVTEEQMLIMKKLANITESDLEMARVTMQDIEDWKRQANSPKNKPTTVGVVWDTPKISKKAVVWLVQETEKHNFKFDDWVQTIPNKSNVQLKKEANFILDNMISNTNYGNSVDSGIAGWFDRYPRIPYGRPTAYTFHHYDKFKLSYPFLENLAEGFKQLLPERFATQMKCANALDPSFRVPNTPFTTITVNKNFRTAAHRDAGDLTQGFSNLTVVAKNNDYSGGYLICPEVRAAVNVRPGDLLLINNHEFIHGNTPIVAAGEATEFERISLVCYFREAMLELGTREYEDLRYTFVETRKVDKAHPDWRPGWNGVSPGMWESDEWYEFIETKGKPYMFEKYHPEYLAEDSLEEFFA